MSEDELVSDAQAEAIFQLADDFTRQCRLGECPDLESFAAQHAEHHEEILRLFPLILTLEEISTESTRSQDGRVEVCPQMLADLADFRVIREISRGGMGAVFEAEQISLQRHVALKVLPRKCLRQEQLDRFHREARIASQLHHSNIVPFYWSGESQGYHYFAMQLIDGRSASELIHDAMAFRQTINEAGLSSARMCARWVTELGIQLACALEYVHDQGVVHRDIKPENLLIDRQQRLWLSDFGISTRIECGAEADENWGTAGYSAPEQCDRRADLRSDIYSAGCTLDRLLQALNVHMTARGGRSDQSPRELRAILDKAMANNRRDRYQTAAELRDDLERFRDGFVVQAEAHRLFRPLQKWALRNPSLAASFTTTAVLLALAIGMFFQHYRQVNQLNAELSERTRRLGIAFFALDGMLHTLLGNMSAEPFTMTTSYMEPIASSDSQDLSASGGQNQHDLSYSLQRLMLDQKKLEAELFADPVSWTVAVKMRRRVGETMLSHGGLEKAERAYLYAISLIDRAQENSRFDFDILQTQRVRIYHDLAEINDARFHFRQADEYREQCDEILQDLRQNSDLATIDYLTAKTKLGRLRLDDDNLGVLKKLADVLMERESELSNSIPNNIKQLDQIIDETRQTVERNSDLVTPQILLSQALAVKADLLSRVNFPADDTVEQCVRLLARLQAMNPGSLRVKKAEALALSRFPPATGNEGLMTDAIVAAEFLVKQKTERTEFRATLALLRYRQAICQIKNKSWLEAERSLHEAIRIQSKLANYFPDQLRYHLQLIASELALIHTMKIQGRAEESLAIRTDVQERIQQLWDSREIGEFSSRLFALLKRLEHSVMQGHPGV